MKIWVTGSHGQLGNALVGLLLNKATQEQYTIDVIATDIEDLDLCNQTNIDDFIRVHQPDYVINTAAYTAVDQAESDAIACFQINRDAVRYLAQAVEAIGSVLIHISTDYVFDGQKFGLYTETDVVHPSNIYGESKLAGEKEVIAHCSRYIILRTSWVFSATGQNFVNSMMRLAESQKALNVVSDQIGGPTYADDLASTLFKICCHLDVEKLGIAYAANFSRNKNKWGIYHYQGMPHVSWFDFAKHIFQSAQKKSIIQHVPKLAPVKSTDYPTAAKRPLNSKLDVTKISTEFAIEPSDWQSGLEDVLGKMNESHRYQYPSD